MLFMLSDSVYQRAHRELANKPIHLSLLNYLWPLVKDFDFEANKVLEVMQPVHELLIVPSKSYRAAGITGLMHTGEVVGYSNRTIRRTLSALGLKAGNRFSDGLFRIKMGKTQATKS